jgi:hypothetical protein
MSKLLRYVVGVTFALVAVGPGCGGPTEEEQPPIRYYIQLIRGNDSDKPPVPGNKPVGPKLDTQLRAVFRWQSYWEVNREDVKVAPGRKTKVRLSKDREVEIDRAKAGTRRVTAFQNGKALECSTRPLGEAMTLIGGKRDPKSVWFIVVRRDKPPD